jgi:hypothetical protein
METEHKPVAAGIEIVLTTWEVAAIAQRAAIETLTTGPDVFAYLWTRLQRVLNEQVMPIHAAAKLHKPMTHRPRKAITSR